MKIITNYDPKPIPSRNFDWSAVTDNYDGAPDAGFQPVGHGESEQLAIDDLMEQIDDHETDLLIAEQREERRVEGYYREHDPMMDMMYGNINEDNWDR